MKIMKKVAIGIVALLFLSFLGLCIYALDYRTLLKEYEYILEDEDVYVSKDEVCFKANSDVGFIFYPGGRIEYSAYAPLCQKLQEAGINVFLVDMPFNMACFGINKANDFIDEYEDITSWYVGGHSLGGVACDMYGINHEDKIEGLIFMGIYESMGYDLEKTITIVGSNDMRVGDSIDYETNVHIIEGGNHAQFGNYGPNDGDGKASISTDEQQDKTVELIIEFMKK